VDEENRSLNNGDLGSACVWLNQQLNKLNCGTREIWYAPGVGIVRYRAEQESGRKVIIELDKYHIQDPAEEAVDAGGSPQKDCFPLAVGNWWEYRFVDIEREYVVKDRIDVRYSEVDRYYLSHYKYALLTNKADSP
jgi:hypothetical protein